MSKCKCCGHKADKVGFGFAYCLACYIKIYGEEWD